MGSDASSGGQVKSACFIYFPWLPLEAGLSVSPFRFSFTRAGKLSFLICTLLTISFSSSLSVCLALSFSKYSFWFWLSLKCCNICWLNILLFLRANFSQVYSWYIDIIFRYFKGYPEEPEQVVTSHALYYSHQFSYSELSSRKLVELLFPSLSLCLWAYLHACVCAYREREREGGGSWNTITVLIFAFLRYFKGHLEFFEAF
jgi:hypothetical protein